MSCLLLLAALFSFGFFGAASFASSTAATDVAVVTVEANPADPAYTDQQGVEIQRFAVAFDMDDDGCPVDETMTFLRSQAVYVFAIGAFPRDTDLFARLIYDGVPIEDTDLITADRNYDEVCANFVFEPTLAVEVFDRGPYNVEFFVNGFSAGSVHFIIE